MSRTRLLRCLWLFCLFCGCIFAVVYRPPLAAAPAAEPTPLPVIAQISSAVERVYISAPQTSYPPAPTLPPTPSPTPVPEPFCIAWISDTQYYAYKKPAVFQVMARWLVENRSEHDILFTVHTGDIVDNRNYERHWSNAKSAIDILTSELPLYCVAGNHDVGADMADYQFYHQYDFCAQRDETMLYEGGECWYHTFSEGGTDFLLLGIGWRVDEDHIPWCETVLSRYSDHVALILVHSFLTDDGALTTNGKLIERRLIQPFSNVRLVLCGHNDGSARCELKYGERIVNALMYNFQDDKTYGLGYLRLMMFNPLTRNIAVTTYSPYLDDYNYYKDESRDTFTLFDAF
ncbi:MAG: metallophosphoesterase [Clostridia bacterium]|nr:metallophosphoesterase [Clostridia bacterium]